MNLPPISPQKPYGSASENEQSMLFKRSEDQVPEFSASSPLKCCENEVQTFQPKYMTGYGGFQPQQDTLSESPTVIVSPVVGYTGNYRGRNIGKLGRCEVHKTRLSAWEKDTVSSILGVPHTHNDWEYSHYTNKCGNFAEKKYHEVSTASLSPMGSLPNSPGGSGNMSGGGSVGCGGISVSGGSLSGSHGQFSDGLTTATNARYSPSLMQHQQHREQNETDRILQQIQQGLETKYKTSQLARSALKAAFFALDRQRSGLLSRDAFFAVVQKLDGGVVLSEVQCTHLATALATAGHSHDQAQEEYQYQEADTAFVNYGRFLNVLVPRLVASPVPGSGARVRRRASISASSGSVKNNNSNSNVDINTNTSTDNTDAREKSLVHFS